MRNPIFSDGQELFWEKCGDIRFSHSGPFRFLDVHGAAGLVKRMEEFRRCYGERFAPCDLLVQHAKQADKHFHNN